MAGSPPSSRVCSLSSGVCGRGSFFNPGPDPRHAVRGAGGAARCAALLRHKPAVQHHQGGAGKVDRLPVCCIERRLQGQPQPRQQTRL